MDNNGTNTGSLQEMPIGYDWMCGVCPERPKFETLLELFSHKTEIHSKTKDTKISNEEEEVKSDYVTSDHVESISDDEDDLPLSTWQRDNVNRRFKMKIKFKKPVKRRKNKKEDTKCNEQSTRETDLNSKFAQLVEEAIQESDQEFNTANYSSWGSPFKVEVKEESQIMIESVIKANYPSPVSQVVEDGLLNENQSSKDEEDRENAHICKVCNEEFASRKLLSKHKYTHRCPETGVYKCNNCGKTCRKFDNYARHLVIHVENRSKSFQCDLCYSRFYNGADLKRHQMLHLEVKPFTCDLCSEGFTRHDALMSHKSKHTGVPYEKFTCKLCGKALKSPSALAMHSKNHTEKSIFCQEPGCSFSCYLKSQLRQHVRKHNGEKPYQCAQCGRCFARSNDMKNHVLNVHQRFRPFKCPDCPKEFTLSSGLKAHQLSHLNVRPYLCDECGKRFSHPSSLRKHVQAVHKNIHEGKRSSKMIKVKTYADVGVQSEPVGTNTVTLAPLLPAVPVPITFHFAPLTVTLESLDETLTQTYVIPTASIPIHPPLKEQVLQ